MAKADEIVTWVLIIIALVLVITHPAGTAVLGAVGDSSFTNAAKYLTGSNQAGGTAGSVAYGSGSSGYSISIPS